MKILFISRWFPYPPNNGSKIRISNLLDSLAQKYEITLISFFNPLEAGPELGGLKDSCNEIHIVPWKPYNPTGIPALLGFFSSKPRSIIDTFSEEMSQKIDQVLSAGDYKLVIASEIDMAAYSPFFRGLPTIFEDIEIGVLYDNFRHAETILQRIRHGLTWIKFRAYLTNLLNSCNICTVVSENERQQLIQVLPEHPRIEVVPNCVDLASYQDIHDAPQPHTIIFTGSFTYLPNYNAMVWFLRDVFGKILVETPEVHLTITGKTEGFSLPSVKNVSRTGFVDDVRPLIAQSWCSVVPILTGGGTRLKILEAMALGTPVVTTSKGAEGLDVQHGEHVLIADTPQDFANSVIQLFHEQDLRRYLVCNAYDLLREKYDSAVVMPQFVELIEHLDDSSSE